jgi:ubiquinone/menaquinone biosynthesis C-methylase UbiE
VAGAWLRAASYQLGPGHCYQPAYAALVRSLNLGSGTLLDLGCGPGGFTVAAARHCPALHCVGLDRDPTMWRMAQRAARGLPNCRFLLEEAASTSLETGAVDAVVSLQSMHHWQDTEAILGEIKRILRPGGRAHLLAANPEGEIPAEWIRRRAGWPPDSNLRARWRKYSLDAAGFQAICEAAAPVFEGRLKVGALGFYRHLEITG